MALVCDLKSDEPPPERADDPDVEDGEITDDDDDDIPPESTPLQAGALPTIPTIPPIKPFGGNVSDSDSQHQQGFGIRGSKSSDGERSDDRFSSDRERGARLKHEDRIKGRTRGGAGATTGSENDKNTGHRHMTEAERSILHLRKREKMIREREKWEKHQRKDPETLSAPDDDFARNIEKTLATILNKKEKEIGADNSDEVKVEQKRGKKRKKDDWERRSKSHKHRRLNESTPRVVFPPPSDEFDDADMLNLRGGSPSQLAPTEIEPIRRSRSPSGESGDDSADERSRRKAFHSKRKKEKKLRRKRQEEARKLTEESQDICVFYLQGKCQKSDCPYSHEVSPPMKLELCKFYLMDCCAKGNNCSYMHSEFPCKFYHTGLTCNAGKDCKFAHGEPLSEGLKQILFKHIETAPRDILQGFPRLSRDEALNQINQTQKRLMEQANPTTVASTISSSASPSLQTFSMNMYRESGTDKTEGAISDTTSNTDRDLKGRVLEMQVPIPKDLIEFEQKLKKTADRKNKPSRWQQDHQPSFGFKTDQDMSSSNGDVDMRTLPALTTPAKVADSTAAQGDVDIRSFTKDLDIRPAPYRNLDVDSRQSPFENLADNKQQEDREPPVVELPQTTRDLLARINATQKDNTIEPVQSQQSTDENKDLYDDQNINWYSDDDDDDDNRLTIKMEDEDVSHKRDSVSERDYTPASQDTDQPTPSTFLSPPEITPTKTADIVEKLGDLSKIDISAEVTKLLTSMNQNKSTENSQSEEKESPVDPRLSSRQSKPEPRQDPRLSDPRQRPRQSSTESKKSEKMSIYEQGGIDMNKSNIDADGDDFIGSQRSDIDLRNMSLPFKGMQNYTPATEIDASLKVPMEWKVYIVDIPRPDYTGLKLSINDAETSGDPRLRKIFRLSVDEKDSPASPKSSPKHGGATTRIDPRLRKADEKIQELKIDAPLTYNQQLTMLQSSQFYQSLTSNQKLMLNQELARHDQGGGVHDPVLNNVLSNLNIIPSASNPMGMNAASSILNNLGKIANPMLPIGQQGLLGAAPGIPHIPPDFPGMNFDPRGGGAPGLLGSGPPGPPGYGPNPFGNMNQNFGNYNNEEYYDVGFEDIPPPPMYDNSRMGRGFNNNNNNNNNVRDGRRRGGGGRGDGGFRGGRGNRGFHHKRGGSRDKGDRGRGRRNSPP